MKKKYVKPEIEIVELELTEKLLSASEEKTEEIPGGEGDFGSRDDYDRGNNRPGNNVWDQGW